MKVVFIETVVEVLKASLERNIGQKITDELGTGILSVAHAALSPYALNFNVEAQQPPTYDETSKTPNPGRAVPLDSDGE